MIMKRKLKKLLPVMATVLFLITLGCSKDKDDDGFEGGSESVIEVKISNLDNYSKKIDYVDAQIFEYYNDAYIPVGSAPFVNGSFRVELSSEIDESYLESVKRNMPAGITFSNPNAKITVLELFGRNKNDAHFSASFSCQTYNPMSNTPDSGAAATYIYSDSDVKITGTTTEYDAKSDLTAISEYNLSLKRGWNIVYGQYEHKGTSYKNTISNKVPNGLKWWAL
jgi:hypothetical protein